MSFANIGKLKTLPLKRQVPERLKFCLIDLLIGLYLPAFFYPIFVSTLLAGLLAAAPALELSNYKKHEDEPDYTLCGRSYENSGQLK